MASKVNASTALFLSFNLLFFALVSSSADQSVADSSNGVGGIVGDLLNGVSSNRNGIVNVNDLLIGGYVPHGQCNPLKLDVCADLLNGLVHLGIGKDPTQRCCPLIAGLVDLDAAVCLCTAIRANVLGINLDVPISLSLLLNYCERKPTVQYQCTA